MPDNKSVNEADPSVSNATELSNDDLDKVVGGGAIGDAAAAALKLNTSSLLKKVSETASGINQNIK